MAEAVNCNFSRVKVWYFYFEQTQSERDELYSKFVKAIHEVQQKSGFKNLLLEKKLSALADTLEKKEAQLNEVLSASNLDPTALTVVTRKLEVSLNVLGMMIGFTSVSPHLWSNISLLEGSVKFRLELSHSAGHESVTNLYRLISPPKPVESSN